jgi:riboflavin biosynthesis pyrimidine reductase
VQTVENAAVIHSQQNPRPRPPAQYGRCVRQLLPTVVDSIDASAVYAADARPRGPDRPWLLLDMISSADGATHIDGTSGALGSEGDHVVFRAIRAVADLILVAAGTVRSENYRPVRATDDVRAARVARGQTPVARLAILSRHLDFDFTTDLFTSDTPPLLLTTTAAPASAVRRAEAITEVVRFDGDRVDMAEAVRALGLRGANIVLAEGGPALNGQLHDAGLIDELCLTFSPLLVGTNAARVIDGASLHVQRLTLDRVLEEDGWLFLRYVRR